PPADPNRRMTIGLVVMLFVLSMFAGRLIQLQGLDASALATAALDTRQVSIELPARRGDITDAAGAVLAATVDRRDVRVDQTLVHLYPKGGLPGAAAALAPLLQLSVDAATAKLTGTSRGAYLARSIEPDLARRVLKLQIPGMDIPQASSRTYPATDLAANVLGFVAADGKAYGGVEGGFDAVLAGTAGSITYERGKDGTRIPTGANSEVEPRDGGNVRLTIDRDLQWKAQQLLEAKVRQTEAESGSIAVVDPRTGQVLALATAPTFDPNQPGKAPESARGNPPLLDVFEPGSTSKVITLSAALEEGTAQPLTQVTVPNRLKRADRSFRDAEEHGVERLTAAGVLAKSSNIGTIMLGEKVPAATMEHYLRQFGLGAKTGVGLPESAGILAPASAWSGSQRYTVLFGQGLSLNTVQAAQVFATIANDGVRIPPSIVAGYTAPDGTYHATPAGAPVKVLSPQTARSVRQMMEGVVVEGGTAVKAAVPGYRVAGKTGTAQRAVAGGYRGYTASFIGMAPAENPALVIAVILQNPVRGHYGGEVAAPVFSELMTYALAHRKVPPSTSKSPEIPTTWH
ncbi:MAG: penicillin-binding protein 2, partial [Kineosporiaceae bacterium]